MKTDHVQSTALGHWGGDVAPGGSPLPGRESPGFLSNCVNLGRCLISMTNH